MDGDQVGFSNPRSDGNPDLHFRAVVTVPQPKVVTSIAVFTSDAYGNREGPTIWDTDSPNFWVLGVVRGATRLNPRRESLRDPTTGSTAYDLYGSTQADPAGGLFFSVIVQFDDQSEAYGTVAVPPKPTPTPRPGGIVTLTWNGLSEDKVGAFKPEPDGIADGKFHVTFELGSPKTVTKLFLYGSDQYGTGNNIDYWTTMGQGQFWLLAVYKDGLHLNPKDEPLNDRVVEFVAYDIYFGNEGYILKGNVVTLEVTFSDGSVIYGIGTIG